MSHTYINSLLHVVFSTHLRQSLISDAWASQLHGMLGGIARDRGFPTIVVGGVADHVHLLVSMPGTMSISECMHILKGTSSKWINERFVRSRAFRWQDGYGVFSIAQSQIDATVAYIRRQVEHHRRRTFQDEYRDFLTRQGLVWDEKYVWG